MSSPEQIPNQNQQGSSEVQSEKLFWKKVAEEIKETDFRNIYETIFPDIESGDYALARQALREELRKVIAEKNPAMYGNTDQRGSALLVLKEEFYKTFPEIEALLEETEEERGAKIKRPSGELSKEEDSYEKWEQKKGKYWVEKLEWPVPAGNELTPGLAIQFLDRESGRLQNIKFLEFPRFNEGGDLAVTIDSHFNKLSSEMLGSEAIEEIKLADYGLVADAETGLWNSRFKPMVWELPKKEEKKKRWWKREKK